MTGILSLEQSSNQPTSKGFSESTMPAWELTFPLYVALPLTIAILACSVLTVLGNLLVLIAFFTEKRLQTTNNYFLLSLALADFFVGLISVNIWLILYLGNSVWAFGWPLCVAWIFIDYVCCTTSIYHIFIISIDRYWSVSYPANYRRKMNPKIACVMMLPVWVLPIIWWAIIIIVHPLVFGKQVPNGRCWANYAGSGVLTYLSTSITFWIPLAVVSFLYAHIYRIANSIKKSRRRRDPEPRYNVSRNASHGSIIISKSELETSTSHDSEQKKKSFSSDDGETLGNHLTLKSPQMLAKKFSVCTNESIRSMVKEVKERFEKTKGHDKKAMRTLTFLLGAFIFCWTPWNVAEIVNGIWDSATVPHDLYQFTWLLTYINSSLNPICYAFANKIFRDTFISILSPTSSRQKRLARQNGNIHRSTNS